MSKSIILKKLIDRSLIGILLAGGISTQLDNKALATDNADSSNGIFGLELHYRDSAFQCGSNTAQADIKVNVYDQNDNLLTTMSKGDRYLTHSIDSVGELKFKYKIYNLSCLSSTPLYSSLGTELLDSQDTLPDIAGFSGQTSVQQMLANLDSYEELYLIELGTNDITSSAYDLQDVVFVVDNNPLFPD